MEIRLVLSSDLIGFTSYVYVMCIFYEENISGCSSVWCVLLHLNPTALQLNQQYSAVGSFYLLCHNNNYNKNVEWKSANNNCHIIIHIS